MKQAVSICQGPENFIMGWKAGCFYRIKNNKEEKMNKGKEIHTEP